MPSFRRPQLARQLDRVAELGTERSVLRRLKKELKAPAANAALDRI
jgi:hypothetical protein